MTLIPLTLMELTILVAASLAIVVWSLIGRREGSDPYCRKCKYNLTGLPSDKCPECGRTATGRNVRIGIRKRRRVPLITGLALLLTSAGILGPALYQRVKSTNWYPHLPTFVLVWRAEEKDLAALEELLTRFQADTMDADDLLTLVPLALQQQRVWGTSGFNWMDFLAALDAAGCLTREQREQFRDQKVAVFIYNDTIVRQGDELEIQCHHGSLVSDYVTGSYSLQNVELRIGNWSAALPPTAPRPLSPGDGLSIEKTVPTGDLDPGTYTVTLRGTKKFTDPDFERPFTATSTLQILGPEESNVVLPMTDPGLAEYFRNAISFRVWSDPAGVSPGPRQVHIQTSVVGHIHMDSAFDLIVRVRNRERHIGTITVYKDKPRSEQIFLHTCDFDFINGEDLVPILRTNVAAAEATDDMLQIWSGEVIFDPVPVVQPPPEPSVQENETAPAATRPASSE